jgi:hypothetical protein
VLSSWQHLKQRVAGSYYYFNELYLWFRGIWYLILLQALQIALDCLFDVRDRFFYRLTLRMATRQGRTTYGIASVFLVLADNDVEFHHPVPSVIVKVPRGA